ncbi:A disintegrin and metalloproteinase with thrombospondin motifs 2 isoform X1 [Tachysurus ichikawai]
MEVLSKYCSNPGYMQMCCKSCSESNFTANLNLTFTTTTMSPHSHLLHTTQPIPHKPSSTSTPWRYTTTPNPLIFIHGTSIPSTTSSILEETDGPSASSEEEDIAEPWRIDIIEEASESMSGFEELFPATTQYIGSGKSTQPGISSTSLPTVVSLHKPEVRKENNSIDVSYRLINGNEVTQNYVIPKQRVPFRERTQNKRIQQLLEEKRRQDFLKRLKSKLEN